MSKYMTELQFKKWVNDYYQEFCGRSDLINYTFGTRTTKRKGTIIINRNNGKVARSYCHPDDKWDLKTGVAVAYAHYMGIEVPQVEKSYFIENLVGKEVILSVDNRVIFVTPYKKDGFVLAVDKRTGNTLKLHPHLIVRERDIRK